MARRWRAFLRAIALSGGHCFESETLRCDWTSGALCGRGARRSRADAALGRGPLERRGDRRTLGVGGRRRRPLSQAGGKAARRSASYSRNAVLIVKRKSVRRGALVLFSSITTLFNQLNGVEFKNSTQ